MKTLQLSIPDELESRLRSLAAERGISVEGLLLQIADREAHAGQGEAIEGGIDDAWDPLAAEIERLRNRTEAEIEAVRARVIRPAVRPLPPGKTLADVIEGKWPGTETDEEIAEALRRMS